MTGKWNISGKGATKIPAGKKYAEFATKKKKEFVWQIATSLTLAILLGCIYGHYRAIEENIEDIVKEVMTWIFGALIATLVLSILA